MKLTTVQKAIVWAAALLALVFCLGWVRVVLFTDYRAHLHSYLSLAALLTGLFSFWLFALKVWAIVTAWFLALFTGGLALWLQVSGGTFIPILTLVAFLSAAYLIVIFPFIRALTRRSSGTPAGKPAGAP